MANTAQKKIAHGNAKILLSLRKGFIWINAFYIFYRIVYHWSTFGWKLGFGYFFTAGLSIFLYTQIDAIGRPRYNDKGELAGSIEDLTQEGLIQYAFDIIYVTWFVHVTSAFWSKMWWFYISIPVYAGWKAWQLAIKPMLGRNSASAAGDAAASGSTEGAKSKRREKMEKRAEKGPQVRYR